MKVCLLHGAIRHWISLKDETDEAYPYARCGIPINQEDLGHATLIFSYLSVRGMLRLGLELRDEQIESLHLLWRYISHVVGVSEDWLTETSHTLRRRLRKRWKINAAGSTPSPSDEAMGHRSLHAAAGPGHRVSRLP